MNRSKKRKREKQRHIHNIFIYLYISYSTTKSKQASSNKIPFPPFSLCSPFPTPPTLLDQLINQSTNLTTTMTTSYHHHPSPSSSALLLDVMLLKSSLRRQRFRRPSSSSGKLPSFLLTSSTTTPSSSSFAKKHGLSSVTKPTNNSIHNDIDAFMDSIHNNNNDTNYIDQNPAQGKRQRRQAAATLVQNFPSWTGVGKKSKAQPRPQVQIPPRGIGPVTDPNRNDVLCGRGGRYVTLRYCLGLLVARQCLVIGWMASVF